MTYLTDETRATLALLFQEMGAQQIDLPILYHADLFVDLIGEDIRRRLFVAPGANGEAMAMRPELTMPACLYHLATGRQGAGRAMAVSGRSSASEPTIRAANSIRSISNRSIPKAEWNSMPKALAVLCPWSNVCQVASRSSR